MPDSLIKTRHRGFTLLEMIISVALVLVLMLAVTKIFSITGSVVGASQGLAAATRDARAAQTVFAHDIASMASDSPFVFIRYHSLTAAFRNKLDEQSDPKYDGTTDSSTGYPANPAPALTSQYTNILSLDLNDNGLYGETSVPGEAIGPYTVNFRNHRVDRFSFCARDRFYRQTGNSGPPTYPSYANATLASNMSSPEAWITYEHVNLPAGNGSFQLNGGNSVNAATDPGWGTAVSNPNNFYASQWVLGRVAMVMVLPTGAPSATPASEYINDSSGKQEYMTRKTSWLTATSNEMTPLEDNTKSNVNTSIALQNARYDLVGTDIANAKNVISKYTGVWYTAMLSNRFQINPFIVKPITPATVSQQVPVFVPACSQFIVEYAGDFISQNGDGSLNTTGGTTGLTSDGQIDFVVDANGVRHIQWYGLPRSPSGNTTINPASGDVVTVGDFVNYLTGGASSPYQTYQDLTAVSNFDAWERPQDALNNVYKPTTPLNAKYVNNLPAPPGNLYAVWGPADKNRPKMYRITLVIDRPEMAGRMADGQTFEYIFNAP